MPLMSSRQRVRAALEHRPPDRVPLDLTITLDAYAALSDHLGIPRDDTLAPNAAMEVTPPPEVLARLGVDLISVKLGGDRRRKGPLPLSFTDAWGVERRLVAQEVGRYYEAVGHPLSCASRGDLEGFAWPGPPSPEAAEGLREHAARLHGGTELALVGRFGGPTLETAQDLLGMEEWYLRLASDPAFVCELLDRISAVHTAHDLAGIRAAGAYLDILKVSGEDLGMQTGLLYSPAMFREVFLPRFRRRWTAVRQELDRVNPAARIMLHSCGAIAEIIPDLMRSGIDVLDPVQPLARGMSARELAPRFRGKLVFHGGVDIQRLLPTGTPEEVKAGTRACLAGFRAAEGGFIAAPSHAVQADVPPENLAAMLETVREWRG